MPEHNYHDVTQYKIKIIKLTNITYKVLFFLKYEISLENKAF